MVDLGCSRGVKVCTMRAYGLKKWLELIGCKPGKTSGREVIWVGSHGTRGKEGDFYRLEQYCLNLMSQNLLQNIEHLKKLWFMWTIPTDIYSIRN